MAAPMARLNALVDAGVQTHVRGNSVWIGNPGIKIRDANGNVIGKFGFEEED